VIFDATDLQDRECRQLGQLATTVAPAPVVVLTAFPRVEDCRRAVSAGATVVLSKPLAVDDLFGELERVEKAR
jgi:CheY-like chemotaxis protein